MAIPPRGSTGSKLSSEFFCAQSLWFEAQTKHVLPRTRPGRGRRDRYERGIHISQSWSSASVWQNTQVPVLVNYCFDRMSLQFCRVCVRAPSAAPPLYLRPKATVTEPGGEWETEAGRQREREGKREGNRRKKGAIIHLSSAWWNAILTEAANRSITGEVRAADNLLPVRSVWALGAAALPFLSEPPATYDTQRRAESQTAFPSCTDNEWKRRGWRFHLPQLDSRCFRSQTEAGSNARAVAEQKTFYKIPCIQHKQVINGAHIKSDSV